MNRRKLFIIFSLFILLFPVLLGLINPNKTMASLEYEDFSYELDGDEITITKYNGTGKVSVEIPSRIEGKTVTKIGSIAFYNCKVVKNIIIPDSVISIEDKAFIYCSTIEGIQIPDHIISIGEKAFFHCTSLKDVKIPDGIKDISESAYSGCTSLKNIVIPNTVKSIGANAFSSCTSLENIVISEGVKSIGSSAFARCRKLKSIELPMGLIDIGGSAFNRCEALAEINLPMGLKTIGNSAFGGCTKLSEITIPESVMEIKIEAFKGCTSLSNINILNAKASVGQAAFANCTSLQSIFIPRSISEIHSMAFLGSNLSQIYGYKNSEAQRYTNDINNPDHKITFYTVYDVHFDSQGGNAIDSLIAVQDVEIIKPKDPTRIAHVFAGWFKEETLENAWDFGNEDIMEDERIAGEITLYAKWDPKPHISAPQVQLLKGTDKNSISTSMRFLSTIESVDFSEIGFVISNSNSNPFIKGEGCIKHSSPIVYKKIKADGDIITTEHLGGGEYIVVATLDDIRNQLFSQIIYVKPYVKTLDGVIYYGEISTFSVKQCLGDLEGVKR